MLFSCTTVIPCPVRAPLAGAQPLHFQNFLKLLAGAQSHASYLLKCTLLLALIFLLNPIIAQPPVLSPTPTPTRTLSIGDHVPDILLTNLYNTTASSVSLSSYRGKILLLDFWATYCATCVEKMDHMEQLLKQFPKQLAVLLVSTAGRNDSRRRINDLFGRVKNNAGQRYALPVVLNDTSLSSLFPNKYLPHIVWISPDQKVLGITGSEAVTAENIQSILAGNLPPLELKEDHLGFKPLQGLFKDDNGGSGNNFLFRSILTPHVMGIPSSSSMAYDDSGMVTRISHANSGLLFLLQQAHLSDLPSGRIDFTRAGLDLDPRNKDDQWKVNNSYCYELVIPGSSYEAAKRVMQQDLQRYFGITARTEQAMRDCYVLTGDSLLLGRFKTAGGKSKFDLFEKNGKEMCNEPVSRVGQWLDAVLPLPVVTELNPAFNIDLLLPDNLDLNLASLNRALQPYGLRLEPARRTVPIFFIIHQTLK